MIKVKEPQEPKFICLKGKLVWVLPPKAAFYLLSFLEPVLKQQTSFPLM